MAANLADSAPAYPEYLYPFSTTGQLEDKIAALAGRGGNIPMTQLLQLLDPSVNGGKDGKVFFNPTYFRMYYPFEGSSWDSTRFWALENATKENGYPFRGVSIGAYVKCRYGEPLWRGGRPVWDQPVPYHCPYGWRRFGLHVDNFDAKWGNCAIVYHGTSVENLNKILETFITAGVCQEGGDGGDVYLTPSIEYASCPRYATPFEWKAHNGEVRWVQVALQYRCKQPRKVQGETLGDTFCKACPGGWASQPWGAQTGGQGRPYPQKHKVFDPHYKNEELEWLFSCTTCPLEDQLVPVGIMVRVVKEHPFEILKRRWEKTPMKS